MLRVCVCVCTCVYVYMCVVCALEIGCTNASLSGDPAQSEEEHHTPDVEHAADLHKSCDSHVIVSHDIT